MGLILEKFVDLGPVAHT